MKSIKSRIKLINWYPPYLGAGISVKTINDDFTKMQVQMKMRWYNRNLVGTHFGGSLYSMCDPFYMFILMHHLGKGYIVWDKAASITFKKPGIQTVTATFEIPTDKIASIKQEIDSIGKNNYHFYTQILNEQQEVVATVEKVVYVRKKDFDFNTK